MNINIEITGRRIADMMIGAIEGNHMTRSWCGGVYLKKPLKGEDHAGIWYDDEKLFEPLSGLVMQVIEYTDDGTTKKHRLTTKDIQAGLKIMAEKYASHFGDMLAENDDNITQDVFLQCITLKDVVYG
jgi:hypothetical protein